MSQVPPHSRGLPCPLCGAPLRRDRRHTLLEVRHCTSCGYREAAPTGYSDAALRKCSGPACDAPLPEDTGGRPRRYHARGCRQAAYRLRRKSEGITEGIS